MPGLLLTPAQVGASLLGLAGESPHLLCVEMTSERDRKEPDWVGSSMVVDIAIFLPATRCCQLKGGLVGNMTVPKWEQEKSFCAGDLVLGGDGEG